MYNVKNIIDVSSLHMQNQILEKKKMWKEMALVSPSLRLVYRTLLDLQSRLSVLARRLHTSPSNTGYGELEKIKHRLNDIEIRYKHNGVWYIPPVHEEGEEAKPSKLDSAVAAPSSSVSTPSCEDVNVSKAVPRDIPSGQAILNRIIDDSHDLIDRLLTHRA